MAFLNSKFSKEKTCFWKLLTFYSEDSEVQLQRIWDPGPLFFKEKNMYPGANFMYGLAAVFCAVSWSVLDDEDATIRESLSKLREIVKEEVFSRSQKNWTANKLVSDKVWNEVRERSQEVMSLLVIPPNPLDKQFDFDDFIEVERHKFKYRTDPPWK